MVKGTELKQLNKHNTQICILDITLHMLYFLMILVMIIFIHYRFVRHTMTECVTPPTGKWVINQMISSPRRMMEVIQDIKLFGCNQKLGGLCLFLQFFPGPVLAEYV